MGSILVFLAVLAVLGAWWLSKQGLTTKPWLEQATSEALPEAPLAFSAPSKIGLGVFLAVVGALFALFISAYSIRMQMPDWRPPPIPRLLWLNTATLILSSIALQIALVASRKEEADTLKLGLLATGVSSLAFLSGQILAWRQLASDGYLLTSNSANAFFYLLTGTHGLHLAGGLIALGRAMGKAWQGLKPDQLYLSIELSTFYWHFLLLVWIIILSVLTGWAGEFLDICRQLLT